MARLEQRLLNGFFVLLTEKRPIRDLRAEIMTMSRSVVHLSRLRLMFRIIWRLNSCVQRFMGSPIVTRNSSSINDTYYDSQSGQHVAIHDESKITAVYLRGNYRTTSPSSSALTVAAKELGMAG